MKLEYRAFRTKVARRVFLLFILCAILPVAALAYLSFGQVSKQLKETSKQRLSQESKALAVSLYERLLLLHAEMKILAANIHAHSDGAPLSLPEDLRETMKERFEGLMLVRPGSKVLPVFGTVGDPPKAVSFENDHIQSGKACLRNVMGGEGKGRIIMWAAVRPGNLDQGILVGRINPSYLWESAERRPPKTEIIVLDRANTLLFNTREQGLPLNDKNIQQISSAHTAQVEWEIRGETYFGCSASIFLESNFLAEEWIVLVMESAENALAPMRQFRQAFPVILVLTLGMVFLLSMNLIRRSLVPIETLKKGTIEIAEGSFSHRVDIRSRDEFEELGKSFNEMSRKIQESQALLIRSAKMSAVGQMAAGVLHEIKQPLTAISGLLQLILLDKPSDKVRERIETAMGAVERLNNILVRFMSFTHMSESAFGPLSLSRVIGQVSRLLDHTMSTKQIRCVIETPDDLPTIQGDDQGLQQVFSNLFMNAVGALEEKKGEGTRTIRVRAYKDPENRVLVEFEDNGCGIPKTIVDRIFDPFFTTKSQDEGTGLGMAIVESILHQHHATIRVESGKGEGTRFIIAFPPAT